jgi:hypothetical protein
MEDMNSREALLETVRELRAELDRDIAAAEPARIEEPGTFDQWSFKDVIAHLTAWRLATAARLEAGWRGEEPIFPWPDRFDEAEDTDEINQWFYETNRDKPLEQVIAESNDTFERVERAIREMPGRLEWLYWTGEALGPAVVGGTYSHYHEEHEEAIRAWLGRE